MKRFHSSRHYGQTEHARTHVVATGMLTSRRFPITSRTRLTILALVICSSIATIVLGFDVHGAIAQKWQSLGGVGGFLGAPPEETAIDFRDLHVVPFAKLQSNGLRVLGHLTSADTQRCEATIRTARLLSNRDRRRLNLLD
jgi:hypothetical protein